MTLRDFVSMFSAESDGYCTVFVEDCNLWAEYNFETGHIMRHIPSKYVNGKFVPEDFETADDFLDYTVRIVDMMENEDGLSDMRVTVSM